MSKHLELKKDGGETYNDIWLRMLVIKEKHKIKLSVAEKRMLEWMSCFTLRDRIQNEHIHEKVGVTQVADKIRKSCFRWIGYMKRRPSNDPVRSRCIRSGLY
ncbi:hypothetical protein KFK09_018535 [Dendrobium nobile]|uniref:Uncharacterized protein n=1 Tax=Dendrobium nobile TaxID=94219 RepID=A0A8T3AV32_DENNO|nr:hypothetical protein KFK09_018535 [Dendrobium nobile]